MVKGCEKRVVRLQKPDSRLFEEVFFVLRDDPSALRLARGDIVAEASRLLSEVALPRSRRHPGRRLPLTAFLLGAALSAAVILPFAL